MFLDDEEATVHLRIRQRCSSLWVAGTALFACVLMMLALIGTAQAADMRTVSEIMTPQLMLGSQGILDTRVIFSALTIIFSIAAAGLWLRIFRMPAPGTSLETFEKQTRKF